MNRQVIGSAITRTLVILIIAVAAAASGLYLLGKNELIEIGVILAAIVSLLIAPISSYRVLSSWKKHANALRTSARTTI